MGDVEQRTSISVPLLNSYKYGLATRRLLQTATGGLKLRRSPCYINLPQLAIYLVPLLLAIPFIILDSLGVWKEHYLALVYTLIHTLVIFTLRLCVYCTRRYQPTITANERLSNDDDDDEIDIKSCYGTLSFIFHSKHIISIIIHSLLVSPLLSFTSSFILLPRVLLEHLSGITVAVFVVSVAGWMVTCGTHYSLSINQPHETAVYRPTDRLVLGPLKRPVYLILCATAIIVVRLTVCENVGDVYIQFLYVIVCVILPLCTLVGCLPPLDALLPWAMEQALTRLMGGSPMATDLRLLVAFLLSMMSTITVSTIAHYASTTPALLIATITGYLLSHDLFLLPAIIPVYTAWRQNTFTINWKRICHFLISPIKGCSLVIVSVLLVYFSTTADGGSRVLAVRILGSCILALTLLLRISSTFQSTYILRLFRNPLHPWRSEDVRRFKSWRRRLSYCSIPGRLVLSYVSPLLMLVYVTLEVDSDAQNQWLRGVGIARIFRKVWQNTQSAHSELFIVSLIQLVMPEDHTSHWINLGVGLQTLVVGLGLDIFNNFFHKLCFAFTLFLKFLFNDRRKVKLFIYVLVIAGAPILIPISLITLFLSSVISAPILPLFTLPVFLLSFPRTQRFWPSLINYGSSYSKCKDSIYYHHDIPLINKAMVNVFSDRSVSAGDFYLLRYQDRIIIVTILEHGQQFVTLNMRGLEMQETSCHTIEATKIDDIFSSAYNPNSINSLGFWFNCYPLNIVQPVDSVVVCTYSVAHSVLTGIIDQPSVLRKFSDNLLKCIVWVLHHYLSNRCGRQGQGEGETKEEKERQRTRQREGVRKGEGGHLNPEKGGLNWRRRNKIVPVVDSEPPQTQTLTHTPTHNTTKHHLIAQQNRTTAIEAKDLDNLSWNSHAEESHRNETIQHEMSGLIPVDIPLDSSDIGLRETTGSHGFNTTDDSVKDTVQTSHFSQQQSPFLNEWFNLPNFDNQLTTLLPSFPTDWLGFISTDHSLPDTAPLLQFKKLCLSCFKIVDVPQSSLGTTQTKPFHIHAGFYGEFPYSTDRDWLICNQELYHLILKAYRYAVKLLCDETVLGEAENYSELSEYLQGYESDYHIGSEEEPEWEQAILNHVPNLFSLGKSQDTDTYTAHVLTLQDELVHIGQLNSAAVHAIWSDLSLELLYLTNDDEERYSIQAHPTILRNLMIQAADHPLGYAVYSSNIIRCPFIL